MTHELGLTLVLLDVDNVDEHLGTSAGSNAANGSNPIDQATMGNGPFKYETCRRTPSAYDINAFVEHFASI